MARTPSRRTRRRRHTILLPPYIIYLLQRGLEKSLKQISRIVEEQRAQATRDARRCPFISSIMMYPLSAVTSYRIESLERQLKRSKERADELLQQRSSAT